MRDALGPGTHLAYCTNVHPWRSWDELLGGLGRHATKVREQASPRSPMGVGLWLPATMLMSGDAPDRLRSLRGWLDERGLYVFTINGFPYGDFHADVVKRLASIHAEDVDETEVEDFVRELDRPDEQEPIDQSKGEGEP